MTLAEWGNFCVIVGSSAGALIGLQFVVITLIADTPIARSDAHAGGSFATPSVVHFGAVLFLSALACIPWSGISTVGALWDVVGISGIVYGLIVARRLRAQTSYKPVLEYWLFHALLLFAAYVVLSLAACAARSHTRPARFLVGAAAMLLLFLGIHNAWDAVTYHVFFQRREQPETQPPVKSKE